MADPLKSERPVILCALEFESQMLQKEGMDEHHDIVCCGPGADSICLWAQQRKPNNSPVILAGLAGSLTTECEAGSAHVITEVVDEPGESHWFPTMKGFAKPGEHTDIIITSTSATLSGRLARQLMHHESGGMLIDLESVEFAIAASKFNWTWGIVRGVSDDLSTLLPEDIDRWVDDTGGTRWGYVMRRLLCRPSLLPVVLELRTHSTQAMSNVAELIRMMRPE